MSAFDPPAGDALRLALPHNARGTWMSCPRWRAACPSLAIVAGDGVPPTTVAERSQLHCRGEQ